VASENLIRAAAEILCLRQQPIVLKRSMRVKCGARWPRVGLIAPPEDTGNALI